MNKTIIKTIINEKNQKIYEVYLVTKDAKVFIGSTMDYQNARTMVSLSNCN